MDEQEVKYKKTLFCFAFELKLSNCFTEYKYSDQKGAKKQLRSPSENSKSVQKVWRTVGGDPL